MPGPIDRMLIRSYIAQGRSEDDGPVDRTTHATANEGNAFFRYIASLRASVVDRVSDRSVHPLKKEDVQKLEGVASERFGGSGSESETTIGSSPRSTPEPVSTETEFQQACAKALRVYIEQHDTFIQQLQPGLQQRLVDDMEAKDAEGITPQFANDVKRQSVLIRFEEIHETFQLQAASEKEVQRAKEMIETNLSKEPKWVDLTQSICTQTSANETGLNAMIGDLNVLSADRRFLDNETFQRLYSFDLDVPTITIIPERKEDGTISALNISCYSVSSVKDCSDIERHPFSLEFNSSYRVTLDKRGQPVVSNLHYSAKIVE